MMLFHDSLDLVGPGTRPLLCNVADVAQGLSLGGGPRHVWNALWNILLGAHTGVCVSKMFRHRGLDLHLSESPAEEAHTSIEDLFGPFVVVVSIKQHNFLAASIIVVELL